MPPAMLIPRPVPGGLTTRITISSSTSSISTSAVFDSGCSLAGTLTKLRLGGRLVGFVASAAGVSFSDSS